MSGMRWKVRIRGMRFWILGLLSICQPLLLLESDFMSPQDLAVIHFLSFPSPISSFSFPDLATRSRPHCPCLTRQP